MLYRQRTKNPFERCIIFHFVISLCFIALILKRNFFALPTLFDLLMFPIFIFRKTYNWAVPLSNIISAREKPLLVPSSFCFYFTLFFFSRREESWVVLRSSYFFVFHFWDVGRNYDFSIRFLPSRKTFHQWTNEEIKIYAKHKNIKTFLYLFWFGNGTQHKSGTKRFLDAHSKNKHRS